MSWIARLSNLVRAHKLSRGLDEELKFHIDARTRDNMAAGMTPHEARYDAITRFGNSTLTKERTREMDIIASLETVYLDLRYALRGLRRSPGFALTVTLSLALGIGASTAIFTVADNLLLRPLPYRDPSRLMMLWEANRPRGIEHNVLSPGNYLDWKTQNTVFESTAAFSDRRSVLTYGSHVEELGKQSISAELIPMLGVKPIRGRLFTPAEEAASAGNSDSVLVISYRVWQSWFAGDENIAGRHVQVNSTPRTIIGVMPPDFYFRNREVDLWEPLGLNPARDYRKSDGRWVLAIGRLKPGVTHAQAQAQMTSIAKRLEASYPRFDKNWTVDVEPLRDSLVREVRPSLLVLLGAVGLLLAVACANAANLLLARYRSRRQEMAVRASLGAGRWRVMRQIFTESVLLGLAGGFVGILLARWTVAGLLAFAPANLTRSANVAIDLRILLFAVALSLLTGVVFGLAPSLATSHIAPAAALHDGSRSSTSGGRLRSWLVGAEVALSVMLLAGAGLLFRSVVRLQAVDPGLNPAGVLTFRVSIPAARYPEKARAQFFARALERIEQLPGVQSASAVSFLPFNGMAAATDVYIAGRPVPKPGEGLGAVIRTVMPGYFRTLGIPLKHGRDFTPADNTASSPYRFIVNEAFIKKFGITGEPLGQSLSAAMDRENPYGEIVGIVADVKEGSVDKEPAPTVYYIYSHLSYTSMSFVVRSSSNPIALAGPVRQIVRSLDPGQPVSEVRTMEEILGQTFARQRFSAVLLEGFSMAALLLAGIGIYGLLAYSVSERSREIGVRVALGAEPGRIIGLVLGEGARLVLAGAAAGTGGALVLSSLLRSLLFGIGPHDPLTFVVVPAVLMGVALIAAYVPARRAARLDPMAVLRSQ